MPRISMLMDAVAVKTWQLLFASFTSLVSKFYVLRIILCFFSFQYKFHISITVGFFRKMEENIFVISILVLWFFRRDNFFFNLFQSSAMVLQMSFSMVISVVPKSISSIKSLEQTSHTISSFSLILTATDTLSGWETLKRYPKGINAIFTPRSPCDTQMVNNSSWFYNIKLHFMRDFSCTLAVVYLGFWFFSISYLL